MSADRTDPAKPATVTTVHYSVLDEWYALNPPQCRWQYELSAWFSACGKTWILEGTPAQNNYRFCPWCGKGIILLEPTP